MSWLLIAGWFRRHWEVLAVAAVVGLLTVMVARTIVAYGNKREAHGRAEVRALWQADTLARDTATTEELARQAAEREATLKANDKILEDYNAKLVAAAGERDNYFRLLQRASGEVRGLTAREATGALIAATAGEANISERINRATAGLLVEARNNADQLDALIAVIEPQREPTP